MNNNRIKLGVNIFVINDGSILLGKRNHENGYGTWCLPGGHVEFGESLLKAASRELKEETGLIANKLTFLHVINDPQSDSHYVHINFLAESFSGEPSVTEPEYFDEWNWFRLDDPPSNIYHGHRDFLNTYTRTQVFVDNE